jgi:acyl-CoA thioester hydrolase
MFTATTQIRVRYAETDQMRYVYYGNYPQYYEVGRAEAIREIGFTYKQLEDIGVMMPVVEMNIRYFRPALYDDLLTIKTTLTELNKSKVRFHSEIFNDKNELLNQGTVTLVFVSSADMKRVDMPNVLLEKLTPFFAEQNQS